MYDFNSQTNLIIQGCVAAIIIGMFYNLWISSRQFEGNLGKAFRLFGIGMLFVTIGIIERLLVTFSIINASTNIALWQDLLTVFGLVFFEIGFAKLASSRKT